MSLTGSILTIFTWLSPSFARNKYEGRMPKTIDVLPEYLLHVTESSP
ncbi:hypothetical protein [Cyanobacterium sp. uoEpiScrs1]|nr:hypothetical protein [Cyanobacterium sp. uoEpiScrs1]